MNITLPIKDQFRIVTDGTVFRVEQLVSCGFLWWKDTKWVQLGVSKYGGYNFYFSPYNFNTLEEAQIMMDKLVKQETAKHHGWVPV